MDGQAGLSLQELRPGSVLVRPLDSLLQFPRVQTEDAGHYLCAVNNGLGEDRRELVLTVATPLLVHIRPQHQVRSSRALTVLELINNRIHCPQNDMLLRFLLKLVVDFQTLVYLSPLALYYTKTPSTITDDGVL